MESKIMRVFYGNDCLPYKDSARSVHYPIVGNSFAGSNNTSTIHFYVDRLGGVQNISWVVVSKLPNGKIGYELLGTSHTDYELNEDYLEFDLSSYYTQFKGVVKLALRGYQGEVTFVEDSQGVYSVSGDPLIEVTGTIDIAINYAPLVPGGQQLLPDELTQLIAELSNYLKTNKGIVTLASVDSNIGEYDVGQLFYTEGNFYKKIQAGISYALQKVSIQYCQYSDIDDTSITIGQLQAKLYRYTSGGYVRGVFSIPSNARFYIANMISTGLSTYTVELYEINGPTITYFVKENVSGSTTLSSFISSADHVEYVTKEWVEEQEYLSSNAVKIDTFSSTVTGTFTQAKFNILKKDISFIVWHTPNGIGTHEQYLFEHTRDYSNLMYFENIEVVEESSGGFGTGVYNIITRSVAVNTTNRSYSCGVSERKIYSNGKIDNLFNTQKTYIDTQINGTGYTIETTIDSNYDLVVTLKDRNGNTLSSDDVDLPLESIVTSATYYDLYTYGGATYTNVIVLVLSTTDVPTIIPVGDLVSGLATIQQLTDGLALKVDKTTSANKVYGTNDLGNQTTYTVDDFYDGNIARRDSDGSITVPLTPTQNGHASSKKYVDDSFVFATNSEIDALFE